MNLIERFIKLPLINDILQKKKENQIRTGYLFYSPDKVTNDLYLQSIAMALLCKNSGCLYCENCIKVLNNSHPDVIYYPKDKSFNVLDSKDIIEQVYKKPMISECKIIVIKNIEESSLEAQNKLLKILEEPPKNIIFLVSTTNIDKVLLTVKSRLIKLELPPFNNNELSDLLDEYKNNENFNLAIIKGQGYLGKTLEILQDDNYSKTYNLCKNIVCEMKTSKDVIKYISYKITKDVYNCIINNLESMYRDLLIINSGENSLINNKTIIEDLEVVSGEFSNKALIKIIDIINENNKRQFANVSLSLLLETMLVKILEVKYLCR